MKKFIILLALIAMLILPSACSGENDTDGEGPMIAPTPDVAPEPGSKNGDFSSEDRDSSISDVDRLVIQNGNISIAVENIPASSAEISNLAQSLGGYVVSSNISGEGLDQRGWITIKVPAESFNQAMNSLEAMGEELISRSVNTRDVTEEYTDLDARLRNAEATEQQYLALLGQAKTVGETIQVYDSLSRIRSEIEVLKGRIQYLEKSIEMSQISTYLEPAELSDPVADISWDVGKMFRTALKGLAQFGQWLLTGLIWVLLFSPLWLPLSIFGIKKWRKRKQSKAKDQI